MGRRKLGLTTPSEVPSSGSLQVTGAPISEDSVPTPALRRVRRSRAILKGERKSPQRMDGLWKMLDEKLGGRDGLLEAALASNNPKAVFLAELLLDRAYHNWGTKKLAHKAGLSTPELVDLFRDKKWLQTTIELYEALPDIMKGATDDAKPQFVPCDECKGLPTEPVCYRCKGKGEIRRPGDKDKLSFVGEAAGLVGKKGPVAQTNIQINAQTQTVTTSFEDLMRRASVTIKQIEGKTDDKR